MSDDGDEQDDLGLRSISDAQLDKLCSRRRFFSTQRLLRLEAALADQDFSGPPGRDAEEIDERH
jgi:hypothetical protein